MYAPHIYGVFYMLYKCSVRQDELQYILYKPHP